MKYKCGVCGFIYDEAKEGKAWENLGEDWVCPICGVGKDMFLREEEERLSGTRAKPQLTLESARRTASDLVAETLCNFGVRRVFGMVGHSNLGMADAIRSLAERGRMEFTSIRHEGAAAFAAAAYGKLTGVPAACLTIAGPGATNLLTGLGVRLVSLRVCSRRRVRPPISRRWRRVHAAMR